LFLYKSRPTVFLTLIAMQIAYAYPPIFAKITNPMWSIIAQRVDWLAVGVLLIPNSVG